jgi:hypothetical protein
MRKVKASLFRTQGRVVRLFPALCQRFRLLRRAFTHNHLTFNTIAQQSQV